MNAYDLTAITMGVLVVAFGLYADWKKFLILWGVLGALIGFSYGIFFMFKWLGF